MVVFFALMAPAYAVAAPTVAAFNVVFGSQSYNVIGSPVTFLPWEISGVQAVFSEPITSGAVASLSGVSASSLSGLGTNTLTWSFPTLVDGTYSLVLAGSGIDALSGAGGALNGGSGFTQDLQVLVGDVTNDGQVNSADVTAELSAVSSPYSLFADINGDGLVNSADVNLVSAAASSVPEPATITMMGLGILGLGACRRKRTSAPAASDPEIRVAN